MAERVITVALNVDASGAEQGLAQVDNELLTINEQLVGMEDNLRNLTKEIAKGEAAKQFEKLNKVVEKNVLSIQDLGVAADNYKNIALAAGTTTPIGQEALKKAAEMEREMDKLNQSVAHLAEGGRNLNAAMQIGTGVVAGYTAFQGVTALLGEENEELQKTFVKLQAAQSVLMGVKELSIALDKKGLVVTTAQTIATQAMTVAQTAYNVVVGKSTGIMKVFRIALASTGIGAIIVGLGLLIANFDKVNDMITMVSNALGSFAQAVEDKFMSILVAFGLVDEAQVDQMKREEELARKQKEFEKDAVDRHNQRLKRIKEERDAKIEAADETIAALELQIDTWDAEGRSVDELTKKVLEAELAKTQAILDANRQHLESEIQKYRDIAALRGQSDEEFKQSMLAQSIDLEGLQERANALIQENENNVQRSQNAITKFMREQGEERAANSKAIHDKMLEDRRKANEEWLKLEAQLTALLLENMEEGAEKELAILMDKQDRERDALIKQHGENAELLEQLDIKQERELQALQDKFEKERLQKEEEYIDQLIDLRLNNMEEGKEKELAILRNKHQQELEEIRAKYGEQTELEKELLEQQKRELQEVEAEFDAQANEEKIAQANETLATIQGYLDQANQINDVLNEIGDRRKDRLEKQSDEQLETIEKNKKLELSQENLSAQEKIRIEQKFAMQEFEVKKKTAEATDRINKKAFQREKAFKLAKIGIDTAAAVVGALAAAPPPVNFINAGIVGAIGAAQAVLVATQKFEGTAGTIQPPSFDAPSSSGAGASGGAAASGGGSSQNNITTLTDPLVGEGTGKVVLSMVEVNEMQQEMIQIDDVATL